MQLLVKTQNGREISPESEKAKLEPHEKFLLYVLINHFQATLFYLPQATPHDKYQSKISAQEPNEVKTRSCC